MRKRPNRHTAFRTRCERPVSFRSTRTVATDSPYALPEDIKNRLVIDVIHDGDVIPAEILVDAHGAPIEEDVFLRYYEHERDWGAELLADALARHLDLDGYYSVEIARVVLDFGRFPGITAKDADYQSRHAINYPFSDLLSFEQKQRLLGHYYDAISAEYNSFVPPAQVKLALHTYDTFNQSGTRRPPVSVLTRCVGYQIRSEMPFGVFDPLYPDILGEFTSDRILRDRLSLTLERAGIHTEHNYPYLLPDGSVEVRSQVWCFFNTARQAFEAEHPDTHGDPAFEIVWDMLLDTNLRSSDSEILRSYLHAFRQVPRGRAVEFEAARRAYERIGEFVRRDGSMFVERYRLMSNRPSALGIEVRKDLVFEFDTRGRPVAPKPREARKIAAVIAQALHIYFTQDCPGERTPMVT
ncbi:hypothetical protein [Haliangium sp.]|uniref:hypothetical protein n=1 Tax=Haliangium sp. TaxID=2663208 RepID=UPI003D0C5ECE